MKQLITKKTSQKYDNNSIEDLKVVVKEIKEKSFLIILLYGPIGAGKTEFVRQYLQFDLVTSPTFLTCNEYFFDQKRVLHIDLYLKKHLSFDIRNEIFDADLAFIEWAEFVDEEFKEMYKKNICEVFFSPNSVLVSF